LTAGFSLALAVSSVNPDVYGDCVPAYGSQNAVAAIAGIATARGFYSCVCLIDEQATRIDVERAFHTAIRDLDPSDTLVVSYSGHARHRSHSSVLLYDGPLQCESIGLWLSAIPVAARVLLIADCCYGAALLDSLHPDSLKANVLLLAACAADEKADGSNDPTRCSPFMSALLATWRDSADYEELHAKMEQIARLQGNPLPVLRTDWLKDKSFLRQRPFSI
jgi:hypothetical protein